MAGFAKWEPPVWVLALAALLGANPAWANPVSDLDARAAAEYNRGLDARDAGQNVAACQHFQNAAVLYENSIYAMMSHSMRTDEDRETIQSAANQQQSQANGAKARAKEVCGRPDGPALTSSSASSSSNDVDWNAEKKLELQRTSNLAHSQYADAMRQYEAGDFAGACASAKLSAKTFTAVTKTMTDNPALKSAFGNPDVIFANAAQALTDQDGYFCVSSGFTAQKQALERDASLAVTQNKEADRFYAAKDYAGACAAARLSADAYARMTSAMQSSPALEAAFDDPAVVYRNAKIMAADRDGHYCAKTS